MSPTLGFEPAYINAGAVHFIDLTPHTDPSRNTLKGPHYVTIVMNNRFCSSTSYNTAICIPCTSMRPDLWNNRECRLKFGQHHLLYPKDYPGLRNETVVKCDQIFTINKEYLSNFQFFLSEDDLKEIRAKTAFCLGF